VTQKSLLADDAEFIGTAKVIPAPPEQLPARTEPPPEVPAGSALATLREHALSVPIPVMLAGLDEFAERRRAFRAWLLDQLIEGVHYGYSPGCTPKWCDRNGHPCGEAEAWGTVSGRGERATVVPFSSWRPKKSLYEAGADFICELMGVRVELAADSDAWIQAGSQANTFCVKARLWSRATRELLGDGQGLQNSGSEQTGANAALKKAGKRATVAAVLNWLGLRDLFSHEDGEGDRQPHDNPAPKADAPKSTPRGKRVTPEQLTGLIDTYKACRPPEDRTPEAFAAFAAKVLGRDFAKVTSPDEWTADDLKACRKALEEGQ
jgi:hypothetical protein